MANLTRQSRRQEGSDVDVEEWMRQDESIERANGVAPLLLATMFVPCGPSSFSFTPDSSPASALGSGEIHALPSWKPIYKQAYIVICLATFSFVRAACSACAAH